MDTTIRRAAAGDAHDIAHIHVVAWQTTYRGIVPQPFLDSLDEDSRAEDWNTWLQNPEVPTYIAERDGRLCGFISGGKLREPMGHYDAELYAIYLLPSGKGDGIGKLLTQRLAEALIAQAFRSMAVWVLADNPARNFYAHLGAQQIAEKTIRIGDAELLEVAYGWQDLRALTTSA